MEERIIDTCCLINLYATGDQMAIFEHFHGVCVSDLVQQEALWIRCIDHESPENLVPRRIDLSEAVDAGLIRLCQLEGPREMEWFVRLAQNLDDGEASVLAIAKSRGWIVATDDKKARQIASEQQIRVISTSEMVQRWETTQGMSNKKIRDVLLRIQRFGRFHPRQSDPLYEWWIKIIG